MSRTIVLVSCVKTKQKDGQAHAAADLYTSPWFKSARQFAEREGAAWFILSAEHGLVEPGQQLVAYEKTLSKMKKAERQAWSTLVLEQLAKQLQPGDRIIMLAGRAYRDFLVDPLRANGKLIHIPMEGLELGEQKAWLNAANAAATAPEYAADTELQFSPVAYVDIEQLGDAPQSKSRIVPVSFDDTTVSLHITPHATILFARPGAGDFGVYRRTWSHPGAQTKMRVFIPALVPAPAGEAA